MNTFANRRKSALRERSVRAVDPKEDLEIRVGQRICSVMYGEGCMCMRLGRRQLCGTMRLAAQVAMDEILK